MKKQQKMSRKGDQQRTYQITYIIKIRHANINRFAKTKKHKCSSKKNEDDLKFFFKHIEHVNIEQQNIKNMAFIERNQSFKFFTSK